LARTVGGGADRGIGHVADRAGGVRREPRSLPVRSD
jgi:hypothetical protein